MITTASADVAERRVSELFKECSFPMKADAIAASDNCRGHATSVVGTPSGYWMYRCDKHVGLRSPGVTGTSRLTVTVRVETSDVAITTNYRVA